MRWHSLGESCQSSPISPKRTLTATSKKDKRRQRRQERKAQAEREEQERVDEERANYERGGVRSAAALEELTA